MIQFENLKDLMSKMQDEKVCREHMEELHWEWESGLPASLWKCKTIQTKRW